MKQCATQSDAYAYTDVFRPEIFNAVPDTAKVVLSVGCAWGSTEEALVKKGIRVVGIEQNPRAAEIARERGLTVLEGDVSEINVDSGDGLYDFIIYADILEHLADPVDVLRRHLRYLSPSGSVLISVPNYRHYSIFWKLFVQGHLKYEDAGVLDRTHLRITTRKMVLQWFDDVGLTPVKSEYQLLGRRNRLISACLFGLAKEFIAHIVVCVGKKTDLPC